LDGKLSKAELKKLLLEQFELDVDVDEAFDTAVKGGDIKYEEFVKMLAKQAS